MQQGYVLNQIWNISTEKEPSATPLNVFILATEKQIYSLTIRGITLNCLKVVALSVY